MEHPDYRKVRTGPKSRRIESHETVSGSVLAAEESPNQTEFPFSTEDPKKPPPRCPDSPIHVELCRTTEDEDALDHLLFRSTYRLTLVLKNDSTNLESKISDNLCGALARVVQWSPLGSYILETRSERVTVRGRDDFAGGFPIIQCYEHPEVDLAEFSPGEKYLVTYNKPEPSNPKEFWLKVFDVRTGRMMTGLDGRVLDASWPVIRWAGGKDDKYFATLRKGTVSVYETETFRLLGNKSLNFNDIVDMSWSPADSILALLNVGGKVVIVQIPDRVVLIQKDGISGRDCKMYWQSNGKYLAVQVDRPTCSVFEIFCFKEKRIEVLEVVEKILAFAWEPSGHRFAVICGDQSKPYVSFYSMETPENPGKLSKLATFDDMKANALFWSPTGKQIVLAGLKKCCFNGNLVFFDVDKLETMKTAQHPMATSIVWDPTGRYVATAVIKSKEMNEPKGRETNGFNMWLFCGEHLYKAWEEQETIQLDWRPYGGIIDDEMLKNLNQLSESEEESDDSASEEESDDSASEEESDDSASEDDKLTHPSGRLGKK